MIPHMVASYLPTERAPNPTNRVRTLELTAGPREGYGVVVGCTWALFEMYTWIWTVF